MIFEYWTLEHPAFRSGINKLAVFTGFSTQFCSRLGKALFAIEKERNKAKKIAEKQWNALVDKYVERDEKGVPLPKTGGREGEVTIKKDMGDEFENAKLEFESQHYIVNAARFHLSDFGKVGLTPIEVIALEGMCFPVEEATPDQE